MRNMVACSFHLLSFDCGVNTATSQMGMLNKTDPLSLLELVA